MDAPLSSCAHQPDTPRDLEIRQSLQENGSSKAKLIQARVHRLRLTSHTGFVTKTYESFIIVSITVIHVFFFVIEKSSMGWNSRVFLPDATMKTSVL
jgi:hypothetical protein